MLLLAPNVDVVGIGVVAGDAWLDQAVYHTLKIVELCGRPEVPVAAGSEEPLLNSQEMMRRREALWGEKAGDGWHGAWGTEVAAQARDPARARRAAKAQGRGQTRRAAAHRDGAQVPGRAGALHRGPDDQHRPRHPTGPGHRGQDQGRLHHGRPGRGEPALQLLVGRGGGLHPPARALEGEAPHPDRRLPQDTDDEGADRAHPLGGDAARRVPARVLPGAENGRRHLQLHVGRAGGGRDHRPRGDHPARGPVHRHVAICRTATTAGWSGPTRT